MREHITRRTQGPKAYGEFVAVFFTLSYRRRRSPATADDHERSGKRGTHKESLYREHWKKVRIEWNVQENNERKTPQSFRAL
jgi:hypothetical protein